MGREIRRVPLDFAWPLEKVWEGFLNPHYRECPEALKNNCHAGYTNAGKWLDAIARLIAIVGEEAYQNKPEYHERWKKTGRIYPHPYLKEWPQAPHVEMSWKDCQRLHAIKDKFEKERALHAWFQNNPPKLLNLDEEMADFVKRLANGRDLWPAGGMTSYEIWKALIKAAGVDEETWGVCSVCKGEGMDPAVREKYEAWEETPPPAGKGWQVWETVSEGSPVSPVFPTRDLLVGWLIAQGYSQEAAEEFSRAGWAPSAVFADGKLYRDVESAGVVK